MKTLIALLPILLLSACGGSSGGGTQPANLVANPAPTGSLPSATPTPTPAPTPTPIPLTFYTQVETVVPNAAQPSATYTAIGYCVQYLTATYCWDDGIHAASFTGLTYDFWGVSNFGGHVSFECNGGCVNPDPMNETPSVITPSMAADMLGGATQVNNVFTKGIPTNVNCTLSGVNLECGIFTIDLSQTPLNQ